MTEQKPTPTPKPAPKTEVDPLIRTLSAPATTRVHRRLEHAQQSTQLDKASLIRLAVRLMIAEFYKGNNKWEFPANLRRDMLAATHPDFMDIDLID